MVFTPKKKLFAELYTIDWNATQAAKDAGYSEKTATSQGQRLLMDVDVQAAVAKAMQDRLKRIHMTSDGVLRHLDDMLNADIADILTPLGAFLPVLEWPPIWRRMLSGYDVKEVFDGPGKDRKKIGDVIKVKFIDRLSALDMLGKHVNVQAWKEKLHIEDERIKWIGKPDVLSPDEWEDQYGSDTQH